MDALRGQVIAGQGNSEAAWLASTPLQTLPQVSLATLLGDSRRLVVVAPHPDDEVLGCGGLMASAINAGYEVRVIALTDGEAAYPDDPHWPAARLAPVRRAELQAAVAALGGTPGEVLHVGIPDGRIRRHFDRARAALGQIRSRDTVLVTWANDGHPDHEAAAEAALAACAAAGARTLQYPIWSWHWADPSNAGFLHAGAVRLALSHGAQRAKREAIAAFATQTGHSRPAPAAPILPPGILARFLRPYEVYVT